MVLNQVTMLVQQQLLPQIINLTLELILYNICRKD
jgi:hypothetical protein